MDEAFGCGPVDPCPIYRLKCNTTDGDAPQCPIYRRGGTGL